MPVFNGMPFLPLAVESILAQTFPDFEFVIVNDCSTDGSASYLDSLTDSRIVRIDLPVNSGVTTALQTGLNTCQGEFIARLDADDIAYDTRLAKQVAFMQQNSNVGLLGSFADMLDMNGIFLSGGKRVDKSDIDLRWDLLFKNPFIHSTVMFRTNLVLNSGLGYHLRHAEDYDLWTRLAHVAELALLPEPLIQYRVNPKSWTYTKASQQNEWSEFVSAREISCLVNASSDLINRVRNWVRVGGDLPGPDRAVLIELIRVFLEMYSRSVTSEFTRRLMRLLKKRLGWGVVKEPLYWQLWAWKPPFRLA